MPSSRHSPPPLSPTESGQSIPPPPAPEVPLHRLRNIPRFGIVMAVLLAAAAFPQSALFAVEHIEVLGARSLTPAAIAAIARVEHGQRLFTVRSAEAAARLRAYPRIKRADVRVHPPSTVSITVTERLPALALLVGGRFALLDDALTLVALSNDPAGLPVVDDRLRRTAPPLRVGAPVASEGLRIAASALAATPSALRTWVEMIRVVPGPDLTIVLWGGVEIRAGSPRRLGERLAQIPGALEGLAARGVPPLAVDLRYAGSVVVTPALEDFTAGDGQ